MNPFTEDVSPTLLRLRESKLEETEYLLLILMVRTTFPLCSAYQGASLFRSHAEPLITPCSSVRPALRLLNQP